LLAAHGFIRFVGCGLHYIITPPPAAPLQLVRNGSNHRFEFHKRGELFIRSHNEPLSIAAMCVDNPDRSLRAAKSRLPRRNQLDS
jgi:hypothetical protein